MTDHCTHLRRWLDPGAPDQARVFDARIVKWHPAYDATLPVDAHVDTRSNAALRDSA